MARDIIVTKGDTNTLQWIFRPSSTYDMSSFEWTFTVKENLTDLDAAAKIQKLNASFSVTSASNVYTVEVTLSASDTKIDAGTYYYDLQFTDGANVFTVPPAPGVFIVRSEVTISG